MSRFFVYILFSKRNGTLYVGVTNDLKRRIEEHKYGLAISFTKKYGVHNLGYVEEYRYIDDALRREKQLKRSNRIVKIQLIEQVNPA